MPRFFFDVTAYSRAAADEAGVEVTTLEDAECEAAAAVAEMMVSHESTGCPRIVQVTIRDENHKSLAHVTLTIERDGARRLEADAATQR